MSTLAAFIRLAAMRRRAGASVAHSIRWATCLLWRSHHADEQAEKQKASSANCQPLPETRSAPTEQTS